jgi:hypothetical protein
LLGILISGALLVAPRLASAATMFLSPTSGQFGVGQVFTVTARVNTQGVAVNATEGTLSFNPALLRVVSVSTAGSITNLNVQDPDFSNSAGTVRWAGVILNPGFTGASGNLLTVTFRAVAPGQAEVRFTSGAVLANDGQGTNVLNGMSGGTYAIGAATASPIATPAPSSTGVPEVISPTHPDSGVWYSNNDPTFEWQLPSDVEAVSYLVNSKADANPGNVPDGLKSSVEFKDIPNGSNYFHIKFRRGGVWGPTRHFAFNVDIEAPEQFRITRIDADDTTNPQPRLTFETEDAISGIAKYVMRIGEGDWFPVDAAPVDQPFIMPLQAPGLHVVVVEAVDRAGNSTRSALMVTVVSIQRPVITRYPERTDAQIPFPVGGTAGPEVTVRVKAYRSSSFWGRIIYSDEVLASVDTKADGAGQWSTSVPGLPNGVYRLEAVAIDERGAISDSSDAVTVRVGYGFVRQIWDGLRALPAGVWLLGFVTALVLGSLAWRFWRSRFKGRDERKVPNKLRKLITDMDEEIALLARVAKHRPLYPEEAYLRSKLVQYRKSLQVIEPNTHRRLAKRK